jgi:hypothetical protein
MQKIISTVFIVVGALLTIVGLFFNLLKWDDIFQGIIYGPIILFLGIAVFLYKKIAKRR